MAGKNAITYKMANYFRGANCIKGGGFRPFNFEITILTYYGLGVTAWACTNNLRVVLGPCAQYCPSEALEQRMGQRPKT